MILAAILLIAGAVLFTLFIQERDLPPPEPENPFAYLDARKAAIYENLRDLQFEYRVGKLSDEDYQKSKTELQRELAKVLAEVDKLKQELGVTAKTTAPAAKAAAAKATAAASPKGSVCPSCGAKFDRALRFCGECGKPMTGATA
jgi:hypothetical protein